MKKLIVIAIAAFAAASAQAANVCSYVNAKHIDENTALSTILVTAGYETQFVAPANKILPPAHSCIDGDVIKFEAPVCVPGARRDDLCANVKYVPTSSPIKGETQSLVCVKWETYSRDGGPVCVKHEWQTLSFEYATEFSVNVFAAKSGEHHGEVDGQPLCFTKQISIPSCK